MPSEQLSLSQLNLEMKVDDTGEALLFKSKIAISRTRLSNIEHLIHNEEDLVRKRINNLGEKQYPGADLELNIQESSGFAEIRIICKIPMKHAA